MTTTTDNNSNIVISHERLLLKSSSPTLSSSLLLPTTTTTLLLCDDHNNRNNHSSNVVVGIDTITNKKMEQQQQKTQQQQLTLYNFIIMSILFSSHHGCVVSCLGLATFQWGNRIGSYQSMTLYICYTLSSILGATYITKRIGSKNTMIFGMLLYCFYIASFYYDVSISSSTSTSNTNNNPPQSIWIVSITGAVIGGIGAGVLWTAQGSYYASATKRYYEYNTNNINDDRPDISSDRKDDDISLTNDAIMNIPQEQTTLMRTGSTTTTILTTTTRTIPLSISDNNEEDYINRDNSTTETMTGTSSTTITEKSMEEVTSYFGTIFAAIYLFMEISLRLLSTILIQFWNVSWLYIFALYSLIAVTSTILMLFIQKLDDDNNDNINSNVINNSSVNNNEYHTVTPSDLYDNSLHNDDENENRIYIHDGERNDNNLRRRGNDTSRSNSLPLPSSSSSSSSTWYYQLTAALYLLWYDPKMKYMIGFNTLFGLTASFIDSYVNGTVLHTVLINDIHSKSIGIYTSWISCTATIMSIIFEKYITPKHGKTFVLYIGSICFAFVVIPFLLYPLPQSQQESDNDNNTVGGLKIWGWYTLLFIYTMHGTGRATFESTWKAITVDYFSYEKEGAFANIILQNGFAGSIGYLLSVWLPCSSNSSTSNTDPYCIRQDDGTQHDVGKFEIIILACSIASIFGCWKASKLYSHEQLQQDRQRQQQQQSLQSYPNQDDNDRNIYDHHVLLSGGAGGDGGGYQSSLT